MGESNNHHFYDFETVGHVPWIPTPTTYSHFLRHQVPPNNARTIPTLLIICFYRFQTFENRNIWKCWERRAPNKHEDPLENVLISLNMGSIFSKTMKWEHGNTKTTIFKDIKGFCRIVGTWKRWDFETKKPNNFETEKQKTSKPRNFETKKPNNFETKKLRNQETKKH